MDYFNYLRRIIRRIFVMSGIISGGGGRAFQYDVHEMLMPNMLFFSGDKKNHLWKKGLEFWLNRDETLSVHSVNDTGDYAVSEIGNPGVLSPSDFGQSAKIVVDKILDSDIIEYKDIEIFKVNPSSKTGRSVKVMFIGDSIFEGNGGHVTSPIYFMKKHFADKYGITLENVGTYQNDWTFAGAPALPVGMNRNDYMGESRGYWGYQTFVGMNNYPYRAEKITVKNETLTGQFENPFLFAATEEDKIDYPGWCFHFNPNDISEDGISYAENQNLGCYHIFDPTQYFAMGVEKPEMVIVSLVTNDFGPTVYPFDHKKTLKAADIIISRMREALPNARILVVTGYPINYTLREYTQFQGAKNPENNYESRLAPFINMLERMIADKRKTDPNLYSLSMYAHLSPTLAISFQKNLRYLKNGSNTQLADVTGDVHILDDIGNIMRQAFIDCLEAPIAYLI